MYSTSDYILVQIVFMVIIFPTILLLHLRGHHSRPLHVSTRPPGRKSYERRRRHSTSSSCIEFVSVLSLSLYWVCLCVEFVSVLSLSLYWVCLCIEFVSVLSLSLCWVCLCFKFVSVLVLSLYWVCLSVEFVSVLSLSLYLICLCIEFVSVLHLSLCGVCLFIEFVSVLTVSAYTYLNSAFVSVSLFNFYHFLSQVLADYF